MFPTRFSELLKNFSLANVFAEKLAKQLSVDQKTFAR